MCHKIKNRILLWLEISSDIYHILLNNKYWYLFYIIKEIKKLIVIYAKSYSRGNSNNL